MEQFKGEIYKVLTPDYFPLYACTASACRNTCCTGWSITLTKSEYLELKNSDYPPEIQKITDEAVRRLRKRNSDTRYAEMVPGENHCCKFMTDTQLCGLQIAAGHKALSRTCRVFPRMPMVIGNTQYFTLTMGCEAVTEVLLRKTTPITMQTSEKRIATAGEKRAFVADCMQMEAIPFFDELFFITTTILQNAAYTVPERLSLLALALEALPPSDKLAAAFPAWFIKYAPLAEGTAFTVDGAAKADAEKTADIAVKAAVQLASAGESFFRVGYVMKALGALKAKVNLEDGVANTSYSKAAYQKGKKLLCEKLAALPGAQENLVVNLWHHSLLTNPTEPYNACRTLCALYAMLQIALLGALDEDTQVEGMADIITTVCRIGRHDSASVNNILTVMDENAFVSAAHMAALVKL